MEKALLYGVCEERRLADVSLPDGVGGEELLVLEEGGLAAIVSRLPVPRSRGKAGSGVEEVLAYARVIEAIHQQIPIVPMRFGSVIDEPLQSREFLGREAAKLELALATIEGCDEMGVRLLLPGEAETEAGAGGGARIDAEVPGGTGNQVRAKTSGPESGTGKGAEVEDGQPANGSPPKRSGAAYLMERRRHYARQEEVERRCLQWVERAQRCFAGAHRRMSWEHGTRSGGILLSFSFLVEREDQSAFLEKFQTFEREQKAPAVCTGPWPPYVSTADLVSPRDARAGMELLQR